MNILYFIWLILSVIFDTHIRAVKTHVKTTLNAEAYSLMDIFRPRWKGMRMLVILALKPIYHSMSVRNYTA